MGPPKRTLRYVALVLFFGFMRSTFINFWMCCSSDSTPRGSSSLLSIVNLVWMDSRVVIDWAKNTHGINIINLSAWLKKTRLLINSFHNISLSYLQGEEYSSIPIVIEGTFGCWWFHFLWVLVYGLSCFGGNHSDNFLLRFGGPLWSLAINFCCPIFWTTIMASLGHWLVVLLSFLILFFETTR